MKKRLINHKPQALRVKIEEEILEIEEEILVEPIVINEVIEEPIVENEVEEVIDEEMVICVNTGEIYKDNKEASEKTGVSSGSIKRCCNGAIKSAGKDADDNKLVWQYLKDYNENK